MRKLLLLLPLLFLPACSGLSVATDPDTGQAVVVDDVTGERVPVVEQLTSVGNTVGGLVGVPGIGVGLGAILAGVLARKAKKKAPTAS